MTKNRFEPNAERKPSLKPKTSISMDSDPYRLTVEKEAAKREAALDEQEIKRILLAIDDRVQLNGSISKGNIANFVDAVLLLRKNQAAQ